MNITPPISREEYESSGNSQDDYQRYLWEYYNNLPDDGQNKFDTF